MEMIAKAKEADTKIEKYLKQVACKQIQLDFLSTYCKSVSWFLLPAGNIKMVPQYSQHNPSSDFGSPSIEQQMQERREYLERVQRDEIQVLDELWKMLLNLNWLPH